MSLNNIFAKATQLKLRFPIAGSISVEDVWDLPLKAKREGHADLDVLAQTLDELVSKEPRRSFVDDAVEGAEDSHNSLKLEIVLAVIAYKKDVKRQREGAVVAAGQARVLDDAIQRKKDEQLSNMSLEELQAERAKLTA